MPPLQVLAPPNSTSKTPVAAFEGFFQVKTRKMRGGRGEPGAEHALQA